MLELYKIGISNLASSLTLYENKHYAEAIFLLEQSVEKLNKSFQLYMGIIGVEELHGHFPAYTIKKKTEEKVLPAYKKMEELKATSHDIFSVLDKAFPEVSFSNMLSEQKEASIKSIAAHNKLMDTATKRELVLMDQEGINILLSNVLQIKESTDEAPKIITELVESEQFGDVIKRMRDMLFEFAIKDKTPEEIAKIKEEFTKFDEIKLKELITTLISYFIEVNFPSQSLNYLSIILSPHTSTARYPDNKFGLTTTATYNEKLGIVIAYPQIVPLVKNIIEFMGNLYSRLDVDDEKAI